MENKILLSDLCPELRKEAVIEILRQDKPSKVFRTEESLNNASIGMLFDWKRSKKGYDYWYKVWEEHNELKKSKNLNGIKIIKLNLKLWN
jgi:hypothetical protein